MEIFRRAYWPAVSDSAVFGQSRPAPSPADGVPPLRVKKGAEIFGMDGIYVGSVDGVVGDLIRLSAPHPTDDDRSAHHIPLKLVDRLECGVVRLRIKASEVVSFEDGAGQYTP